MSILVKICGLTNLEDTMDAIELGADFLGFNFYPDSPRYIQPDRAKEIFREIPGGVVKVGIFVNADIQTVIDMAIDLELDYLQFHGDETPDYCNRFGRPWWKAFRPQNEKDLAIISPYKSEWLLIDSFVEKAFGGTGIVSNWDLAQKAKQYGKLILSGGLRSDNIEMALGSVKPYAVDVASGVESSPGVKERSKMEEFIKRVKAFTLKHPGL